MAGCMGGGTILLGKKPYSLSSSIKFYKNGVKTCPLYHPEFVSKNKMGLIFFQMTLFIDSQPYIDFQTKSFVILYTDK
jgi:hypothetical protein